MESIKTISVCLDKSAMDETLIKFTSFIVDNSLAEKVCFINAIKNLDIPKEILKEFPDMKKNAIKERTEYIKAEIKQHFKPQKKVDTNFIIKGGREAKTILEIIESNNSDLTIVGRKVGIKSEGGVLPLRLARRATCSLLIVPEGTTPKMDKVLLPVDFSENAKLSVQRAIEMAALHKDKVEILAQHIYSVPTGYHYSGKSYQQFAEIMKDHSKSDYANFIKTIDTKGVSIEPIFGLNDNDNIISGIVDMSKKVHPDFIIAGAKGRTATSALFIGSFAEKLIHAEIPYPLFIVRPKGQNAGILDYLKKISK
ncbi:MAG: universal stress protein [Cyclobacteriaceae bacterium]|nr:universal stress protein [Cyclobacteriaceae bacterium]